MGKALGNFRSKGICAQIWFSQCFFFGNNNLFLLSRIYFNYDACFGIFSLKINKILRAESLFYLDKASPSPI